ncbi:MAG: F0F1 ATP synthase subunit B' [Campylobacterales bacterium]|nr:F0F1 ATP synthase subunit B' [Campylobacterales bacterium]
MLDISPILLLSSAVVFLLVLARLNSCLYKPLLKHMDDRDNQIKSDMENAKANGANVDGMLEEAKHIIAQAKKEAHSIREGAKDEAMGVADAKMADARKQIEQKYTQFVQELENERVSLHDSLVSQLPQFNESLKTKLSSI